MKEVDQQSGLHFTVVAQKSLAVLAKAA